MPHISPLKLLRRSDKYYLGGGNRLLFAPPFPHFLDRPGLWDSGHYFNFEFGPLFTWVLLDDEGREIPLEFNARRWTPSHLTQQFTGRLGGLALIAEEEKAILSSDVAVCRVRILKWRGRRTKLHLVAWTTLEHAGSHTRSTLSGIKREGATLGWSRTLFLKDIPPLSCGACLGLDRKPASFCVQLSEGTAPLPDWQMSPLPEKFSGKLPGTIKTSGLSDDGLMTLALHAVLELRPRHEEVLTIALAAAPTPEEARANLKAAFRVEDPIDESRSGWEKYFAGGPSFHCSDEYFTRYYWHRWYGLRLNTVDVLEGNYEAPFVCEGIGYFRAPISYSSFCHILENRWRHAGDLARGSLLTFIANQRPDGGFPGYIDVRHHRREMFYHANWGDALLALEQIHPSRAFVAEAYEGLSKYARYFDRERDQEVSGLYDIENHFETGQEYMSRYLAVSPNADRDNWGQVFALKGVDVTVYIYQLKQALARIARKLGKPEDAEVWEIEARKIKEAILARMWDPADAMFYDVDPGTGERTRVKAAVCFYPFLTDIVEREHLEALKRHLLNPKEFWTPFPAPSTSADDPLFSAEPEWKGKRMNCPWNGRVWPMTNSHLAEALGRSAIRFGDTRLKRATVEFITRTVHMMFFDGDPKRPNCFEHYNPLTGAPSIYRGIDDYQHSWINDLILSYVCGIRPGDGTVTIDPFRFGLRYAVVDDVLVRGARLKVEIRGDRFTVSLQGRAVAKSRIGKPVLIDLP
jgi:hypothetical protein